MEQSTDAQEAFTRVLDLNATEIYIDQGAIPSTNLPYSASGQNESTVLSASADLLKYFYQFTLTPSNVVNGSKTEVFFFQDTILLQLLHLRFYKQVNKEVLYPQNIQILLYQMQIQKMQHQVIM